MSNNTTSKAKRLLFRQSSNMARSTTTPPRSIDFQWTKHGKGTIQAQSGNHNKTQLTHISHQAPARCIPLQHRTTTAALNTKCHSPHGAICVMSQYGGGLVQGDRVDWDIQVQQGATLGLLTQGANRIYKHQSMSSSSSVVLPCSQTTLQALVEANALLVHAPDPVSCFQDSRYRQVSHIQLHHDDQTSLCWLDWYSAGRLSRGERWQHTQLENYTTLEIFHNNNNNNVSESSSSSNNTTLCHDHNVIYGQHMGPFTAFASLILYGPQVDTVLQQCYQLQSQLVQQHTRIRQHPYEMTTPTTTTTSTSSTLSSSLPLLAGRCLVGVSHVIPSPLTTTNTTTPSFHIVRFMTQSNEDMYRLLHISLQSLQSQFQYRFYQDRLTSQHSAAIPKWTESFQKCQRQQQLQQQTVSHDTTSSSTTTASYTPKTTAPPLSTQAQWLSYMLIDSSFPIGGFAHSAGLEAVHQIGLLTSTSSSSSDTVSLEEYIQSVVHSTMHLISPLIHVSHSWAMTVTDGNDDDENTTTTTKDNWNIYHDIQALAHSHLCCNEIACRVSLEQGKSLLRVFQSWKEKDDNPNNSNTTIITDWMRRFLNDLSKTSITSHMAPIWGVLTARLGISSNEACQLMAYCIARDIVSSAVRLNLIGPLQSTQLLARTYNVAAAAVVTAVSNTTTVVPDSSNKTIHSFGRTAVAATTLTGCAPLVDTIQPCHNVLSTRLFRS